KIEFNIPRKEMDLIYLKLLKFATELDPNIDIRVCGSYRREKKTSNDIDVIISHPKIKTIKDVTKSHLLKNYINKLKDNNFIIESITSDDTKTKYMGLCQYDKKSYIRRIDMRFIPIESYYTALLYFTGSGEFNKKMRFVAQSMGY